MDPFVPSLRRLLEGIIITLPLVLNQMFQTDVTTHLKPGLIEEKQRKEPCHPPVTIGEWMDT
jgi:hypothetical protein